MNLDFLYTAVSWVLLRWYQLFTFLGLGKDSGLTWALSIIFLVITARLLLFRFFVKQVHYQRRMQQMQPRIKKLQEKHKGDKATLQREMMALQQEEGFNPISGCLPMFLQIPVFISLFHVLKHMSAAVAPGYPTNKLSLYGFTADQTLSAAKAKLFGAPLAASLHNSAEKISALNGDVTTTRIVTVVLVIISAAATFITQRAVIANAPTPAEGQAAMIQKLMLVGIPISVVFSGFIFPLGVLLYWFTSNVWTMGQQFYIFKFHPHPDAEGAGKPATETNVLGKSLAPKPGAKPSLTKGGRPAARTTSNGSSPVPEESKDSAVAEVDDLPSSGVNGTDKASGSAPKPGARPVNGARRPANGNARRPAAKRSPSKKRR